MITLRGRIEISISNLDFASLNMTVWYLRFVLSFWALVREVDSQHQAAIFSTQQ